MRLHSLIALAIVLVASVDASSNNLRLSGSGGSSPRGGGNPLGHPMDPRYSYCDAGIPKAASYHALPDATLKLVQIIHRHGDRTPWHTFTNPAWDMGAWSCAYAPATTLPPPPSDGMCDEAAKVTAKGAKQLFDLGTELRGMYVGEGKPFPDTINAEVAKRFAIRTTSATRTQTSSVAFLAGLYPPEKRIGQGLFVPTRKNPETLSSSSDARMKARAHKAIMQKAGDVEANVEKELHMLEMMSTKYFQGSYRDHGMGLFGAMDVYHTRFCHPENKLPDGVTAEDYWRVLDAYNAQQAALLRDFGELSEMYAKGDGGKLVAELYTPMAEADGYPSAHFKEYSGHDLSITSLLGNLHAKDVRWPPYASNILIETWVKEGGEKIIRIYFNGAPLQTRDNWCDFGAGCPFDTFTKHVTPIMSF